MRLKVAGSSARRSSFAAADETLVLVLPAALAAVGPQVWPRVELVSLRALEQEPGGLRAEACDLPLVWEQALVLPEASVALRAWRRAGSVSLPVEQPDGLWVAVPIGLPASQRADSVSLQFSERVAPA